MVFLLCEELYFCTFPLTGIFDWTGSLRWVFFQSSCCPATSELVKPSLTQCSHLSFPVGSPLSSCPPSSFLHGSFLWFLICSPSGLKIIVSFQGLTKASTPEDEDGAEKEEDSDAEEEEEEEEDTSSAEKPAGGHQSPLSPLSNLGGEQGREEGLFEADGD